MRGEIRPLTASGFAAEYLGAPVDEASVDEQATALRTAFLAHPVLCLRTDGIEPFRFLALARAFGEPQIQLLRDRRHPEVPEISFVSSDDRDVRGTGQRVIAGSHWHTDDSYMAVPCAATLLYAAIIPDSGGDTEFADMTAAYAQLPDDLRRRIADRVALHTYRSRRNRAHVPKRSADEAAESPPVEHPLVRRHPGTGRQAVYLNPNRIERVVGLPETDGDRLLDELLAFCTQPQFVYRHRWQPRDVVIWDNRCTMHKANADYGDARRVMHRILLKGERPE